MSDGELLELAAKAAGFEVFVAKGGGSWINNGAKIWPHWNPLEDDGDALRLALKLSIGLSFDSDCDSVIAGLDLGLTVVAVEPLDDTGARRSIVRAAAEIGRAKP